MNETTEIRKLPPSIIRDLANNLDPNGAWKQLMQLIPKVLEKENYVCAIAANNPAKYNSFHFRLIEDASTNLRRQCTEILLDEWGTSGRIRPALGHLLHLLKSAELFAAAEVITNLLKMDPPERPATGPAARVRFNSEENQIINDDMDEILDNIRSYSSASTANMNGNDVEIPRIVVSEATVNGSLEFGSSIYGSGGVPELVESVREVMVSNEDNEAVSFNANSNESYLPQVSAIIGRGDPSASENIPNLSMLQQAHENSLYIDTSSQSNNTISSESSSIMESNTNVPLLSIFNASTTSSNYNVPDLNALMKQNSSSETTSDLNIPQLSALQNSESLSPLPNFNLIQSAPHSLSTIPEVKESSTSRSRTTSASISTFQTSRTSGNTSGSSRPQCHSPLPNLSLNTQLPHFTYQELEAATNNFDEVLYDPQNPDSNGRFLGKGACASVYLALGLLEKTTAVKKLYLNGKEVVDVDDVITKQFRNEVEVLSKYKHDNLLSICGYSCDGPTYCLLYDYISGGALNVRLEKNKEQLSWQERLRIACGTAEAAAYLHTAFDTPLIHRDIKTANILLDANNVPKLGDFGIIKLSPNQHTTKTTTIIGTSIYMAPETFRAGDVSAKTDSYSFGVVVLELLTALPPLDQERENSDLITHVGEKCENNSIEPLLDLTAGSWKEKDVNVADSLYQIAMKCLEDKKKRLTMVEVRDQLRNLKKVLE